MSEQDAARFIANNTTDRRTTGPTQAQIDASILNTQRVINQQKQGAAEMPCALCGLELKGEDASSHYRFHDDFFNQGSAIFAPRNPAKGKHKNTTRGKK